MMFKGMLTPGQVTARPLARYRTPVVEVQSVL